MEPVKTESPKGTVRIRIEAPSVQSPNLPELKKSTSLAWFYQLLLCLTLMFSVASLYLSLGT